MKERKQRKKKRKKERKKTDSDNQKKTKQNSAQTQTAHAAHTIKHTQHTPVLTSAAAGRNCKSRNLELPSVGSWSIIDRSKLGARFNFAVGHAARVDVVDLADKKMTNAATLCTVLKKGKRVT